MRDTAGVTRREDHLVGQDSQELETWGSLKMMETLKASGHKEAKVNSPVQVNGLNPWLGGAKTVTGP